MFDFSKYNLGELVAINDMLDYIEHGEVLGSDD